MLPWKENNHYCTPMMGSGRFETVKRAGKERAAEYEYENGLPVGEKLSESGPDSGITIRHTSDVAGKEITPSLVGGSRADQFRIREAVPGNGEDATEEGRPIKLSHEPFGSKEGARVEMAEKIALLEERVRTARLDQAHFEIEIRTLKEQISTDETGNAQLNGERIKALKEAQAAKTAADEELKHDEPTLKNLQAQYRTAFPSQ